MRAGVGVQRVHSTHSAIGASLMPSPACEHLHVQLFLAEADEPYSSTIEVVAGRTLHDTLTPFLTQNGVGPGAVDVFVENSCTPIPANSPAEYLVGQRLNVRPKAARPPKQPAAAALLPLAAMNKLSSRSVDESESRSLDEHDQLAAMFAEKASSSRQHLNPMSFYEAHNNFTVPRRKASLNVEALREAESRNEMYRIPSQSSMSGSVNGTRRLRAPSSSRRMILFGKEKEKEKFAVVLEQTYRTVCEAPAPSYLDIEAHFSELVKSERISEPKVRKHQEAIWEIVSTEHRYILLLKNICELHQTLLEVQREGMLADVEDNMVFLNFNELYQTSLCFWRQGIFPMLQQSRTTGDILDSTFMQQAFADILQWSRCYLDFHVKQIQCRNYIGKVSKDNEYFTEFIKWTESMSFMNRHRFLDILAYPFQHLTRYPLMLRSVEKTALSEEDRKVVQMMKQQADEANHTLNRYLNFNDLQQQLSQIMSLFESFDVVDSDEYDKFIGNGRAKVNLLEPMPFFPRPTYRRIYMRGDLKYRENRQSPKNEVHCFLFTDMFLICKFGRRDKLRVIKAPIHTARMRYHRLQDGSNGFYLFAYDAFEICTVFLTFFTQNDEETKKWFEFFGHVKTEFQQLLESSAIYGTPFHPAMSFPFSPIPVREDSFGPESMALYHRKSHSMDSQALATQANKHGLRKEAEVSSAEQLDRRGFDQHPPLPQHHPPHHHHGSIPHQLSQHGRTQKILVDDENPGLELRPDSCGAAIVTIPPLVSGGPPHQQSADSRTSSRAPTPQTPSGDSPTSARQAGRRFEKRYHTVSGECDASKSGSSFNAGAIGQNIVKRFSWNVGSQRKISKLNDGVNKTNLHNVRRLSQSTTESNDSFGSSTSGISSSSSHDNPNQCHDEIPNSNISRVRIDEMSELDSASTARRVASSRSGPQENGFGGADEARGAVRAAAGDLDAHLTRDGSLRSEQGPADALPDADVRGGAKGVAEPGPTALPRDSSQFGALAKEASEFASLAREYDMPAEAQEEEAEEEEEDQGLTMVGVARGSEDSAHSPPPLPQLPPPESETSSDGDECEARRLKDKLSVEDLDKLMLGENPADLVKLILSDDLDTSIV